MYVNQVSFIWLWGRVFSLTSGLTTTDAMVFAKVIRNRHGMSVSLQTKLHIGINHEIDPCFISWTDIPCLCVIYHNLTAWPRKPIFLVSTIFFYFAWTPVSVVVFMDRSQTWYICFSPKFVFYRNRSWDRSLFISWIDVPSSSCCAIRHETRRWQKPARKARSGNAVRSDCLPVR